MRAPYKPPFKVGDRIVYKGNDWGRNRDPYDRSSTVWVRSGATGVVIRNEPGSPAYPGEPYPMDGWSVVRFDHDPDGIVDVAIHYTEDDDGAMRYPDRYSVIEAVTA